MLQVHYYGTALHAVAMLVGFSYFFERISSYEHFFGETQ